jgi:predicted porin
MEAIGAKRPMMIGRLCLAPLVGLIAAVGAPGSAFAQLANLGRVEDLLPSDERDGLSAGGRVQVVYDSNLLRLDEGVPAAQGRSRDDVVTNVSGVVRARISPSLQRFRLDAQVGRDYHARNDFLDRDRILVEGGWDWRIGTRCGGVMQATYSQAQADLAEQGAVLSNRQTALSLLAQGGCRIGVGLKPAFVLSHRDVENSNPLRQATDLEVEGIGAGLSYNRTGRAGVSIGYRRDRFRYPNRVDPVLNVERRVRREVLGVQLDLNLARRMTISVSADINWIDPVGRGPVARRTSGGVTASYRPTPRYELRAQARREIDAALYVAADFVVRDRAEVAATYAISPRTRLALTAGVVRSRFVNRTPVPLADDRTRDRTVVFAAAADYRLRRNLALRLEARHDHRTTDGDFGTFAGTRLAASMVLAL